jgi:hypothetical protein
MCFKLFVALTKRDKDQSQVCHRQEAQCGNIDGAREVRPGTANKDQVDADLDDTLVQRLKITHSTPP